MPSREIVTICGICGDLVRSAVAAHWNAGRRALRAHDDMQAHLTTHSFVEMLRFEIRQDLDQVPEEDRPGIVRDIYRVLLGSISQGTYSLDAADGLGMYSIDEALGGIEAYRLWRSTNRCGDPQCPQH